MVTRFQRYRQIGDVLVKYGFGILVEEFVPGGDRLRGFGKTRKPDQSTYERIRLAIEELGPTYVKFGQIMSTRRELLPPEMVEELQKLQDRVAPVPYGDIRPVIAEHCRNLDECFDIIEAEPVASASLSQLHRAVTRDGRILALKVQRPGIAELIETDITILRSLAKRANALFPDLRVYNPEGMVDEFVTQIRRELDFTQDGMNAERLRRNLADLPCVRIPRIHWDLSGPAMLAMDYMEGVRIDDVEAIQALGLSPGDVAATGFEAYVKQIFVDGFFHGDPHPGNLLVTRQGEVVFLDYGIVGVLRPERRRVFVDLLLAMSGTDVAGVISALKKLDVRIDPAVLDGVKDDLYVVLLDYRETKIEQVNFGTAIRGLTETLRRYRIRVPSTLMIMMKVIVMVMDIGTRLDPSFNFDQRIRPYLLDIATAQRLSPDNVTGAMQSIVGAAENLIAIPGNVNETLKTLSEGTITLELENYDLEEIVGVIDRTSDKIIVGVVVAAVIVGSSLVLRVADVPVPGYVSTLATLGYVFAVIVGFYAVYNVLRHSRGNRR